MSPELRVRRSGWGMLVLSLGLLLSTGALRATAEEKPTEPFRYDPKGLRDPFMPLVREGRLVGSAGSGGDAHGQLVLYGILWDPGGESLAIINDRELKVGDQVDGYRVADIRKDAVVLKDGGEPLVLRITFDASAPSSSKTKTTKGGEGP